MNPKFFICPVSKEIVAVVDDKGYVPELGGKPMAELIPGSVEASTEKHIPVAEVNGSSVRVKVGSAAHPMLPEHFIEWVLLVTNEGRHRKSLKAGDAPEVEFAMTKDEKPLAVYAYCNLHGLWKADL